MSDGQSVNNPTRRDSCALTCVQCGNAFARSSFPKKTCSLKCARALIVSIRRDRYGDSYGAMSPQSKAAYVNTQNRARQKANAKSRTARTLNDWAKRKALAQAAAPERRRK